VQTWSHLLMQVIQEREELRQSLIKQQNLATVKYSKSLLKFTGFIPWKAFISKLKEDRIISECHYCNRVVRRVFLKLLGKINERRAIQISVAESFHECTLLKTCISKFQEVLLTKIRSC
jgi:hypothetical protein